jgi:hypothetical protein
MRFMRCRCGELTCWTSMGSPRCHVCEKCNSTLAESPSSHLDPIPHDFYASIERGQIQVRCRRCQETGKLEDAPNLGEVKAQIAALQKQVES